MATQTAGILAAIVSGQWNPALFVSMYATDKSDGSELIRHYWDGDSPISLNVQDVRTGNTGVVNFGMGNDLIRISDWSPQSGTGLNSWNLNFSAWPGSDLVRFPYQTPYGFARNAELSRAYTEVFVGDMDESFVTAQSLSLLTRGYVSDAHFIDSEGEARVSIEVVGMTSELRMPKHLKRSPDDYKRRGGDEGCALTPLIDKVLVPWGTDREKIVRPNKIEETGVEDLGGQLLRRV